MSRKSNTRNFPVSEEETYDDDIKDDKEEESEEYMDSDEEEEEDEEDEEDEEEKATERKKTSGKKRSKSSSALAAARKKTSNRPKDGKGPVYKKKQVLDSLSGSSAEYEKWVEQKSMPENVRLPFRPKSIARAHAKDEASRVSQDTGIALGIFGFGAATMVLNMAAEVKKSVLCRDESSRISARDIAGILPFINGLESAEKLGDREKKFIVEKLSGIIDSDRVRNFSMAKGKGRSTELSGSSFYPKMPNADTYDQRKSYFFEKCSDEMSEATVKEMIKTGSAFQFKKFLDTHKKNMRKSKSDLFALLDQAACEEQLTLFSDLIRYAPSGLEPAQKDYCVEKLDIMARTCQWKSKEDMLACVGKLPPKTLGKCVEYGGLKLEHILSLDKTMKKWLGDRRIKNNKKTKPRQNMAVTAIKDEEDAKNKPAAEHKKKKTPKTERKNTGKDKKRSKDKKKSTRSSRRLSKKKRKSM